MTYDARGGRWTHFRLGGLFESAEKIGEIAGLEETLMVEEVSYCFLFLFFWGAGAREGKDGWMELLMR